MIGLHSPDGHIAVDMPQVLVTLWGVLLLKPPLVYYDLCKKTTSVPVLAWVYLLC